MALASAPDPAWIVARLAQPVPSRTTFVEVRQSAMLKNLLVSRGSYERPRREVLVRRVQWPQAEVATLAGGEVTLQRGSGPLRRFEIARAPELAGLQDGFGALLDGELAPLQQRFTLAASGSQAQWTLRLVPRSAALAARLQQLVLHGRHGELDCIVSTPARGPAQYTVVGERTRALAQPPADIAAVAALCRGDAS